MGGSLGRVCRLFACDLSGGGERTSCFLSQELIAACALHHVYVGERGHGSRSESWGDVAEVALCAETLCLGVGGCSDIQLWFRYTAV